MVLGMAERGVNFWRRAQAAGPSVFAVATVVCFGGAMLAFGIKPWGSAIATVLMSAWVALVIYSGVRQQRLDAMLARSAVPAKARRRPSQIALRALVSLAPLAVFAYAFLLVHQGKPPDVVKGYKDGAVYLLPVAALLAALIDWIYERLARASV